MPMIDLQAGRARVGSAPRVGSARPPVQPNARAVLPQWSAALGRQVVAGDGRPRGSLLRGLDTVRYAAGRTVGSLTLRKVAVGLLAVGAGTACLALSLPLSPFIAVAVYKSKGWMADREAKAERKFLAEVQAGAEPRGATRSAPGVARAPGVLTSANWLDTLAGSIGQSRFGRDLEPVMALVGQHARQTGKNLSPAELRRLVLVGEAVAVRLQSAPDEAAYQGRLSLEGRAMATPYTAKALAWYMMARAAHQDLRRDAGIAACDQRIRESIREAETAATPEAKDAAEQRVIALGAQKRALASAKDQTTQGAFIMKDPDNRIYRFLGAVPTCAARMSTHMGGRSATQANHRIMGLFEYASPEQKGIEDYQSTLPGPGGTLLFDRLRPDEHGTAELYVKFESAGCPPLLRSNLQESLGDRAVRFFAAIRRNFEHCVNFSKTRRVKMGGVDPSERHEHAYKGALKKRVGDPFKKLVSRAIRLGVLGGSGQALADHMQEYGLHFVKDAVAQMDMKAQELAASRPELQASMDEIIRQCREIQVAIVEETQRLNTFGPRDIESHGAEVHIDLSPPMPAAAAV